MAAWRSPTLAAITLPANTTEEEEEEEATAALLPGHAKVPAAKPDTNDRLLNRKSQTWQNEGEDDDDDCRSSEEMDDETNAIKSL